MPYKDLAKQKQCQHQYYLNNKKEYRAKRNKVRKETREWFLELTKDIACQVCRRKGKMLY